MNLKNKLLSGVFWKGLERIGAQLVSAIVTIVLARILLPDDYSVVSIVTIFFAFCNLFISSGLNVALIQKKDADMVDYSTVLTVNLAAAVLLYLIMFFGAPFIGDVFKKPVLKPIIRVMGITFFVNAYKSVLSAKMSSELKFKQFFVATITGTVISAVVGISMAKKGCGAWSLVAQQMTNSTIDTLILALVVKRRFGLKFSLERFKSLFDYGWKIIVASFISTAYDESKPLIVGIKFSTVDLAYYNKGLMFPSLINSIGNNTLSSTLFPVMSKLQDDKDAVLQLTRKYIRLSSFLVFPMMAGLAATSNALVSVLLTDKWLPIVPYMMIFCLCYAFDVIQIGNIQLMRAIGRSDILLKTEIIKKAVYLLIILAFLFFANSPIALAASSILSTVWATLVNTYPTRKLLNYTYKEQLMDILPNVITTMLMFIIVYSLRNVFGGSYITLVIQVLTGIVVYYFVNRVIHNQNLVLFVNTCRSFIHKSAVKE